MNETEIAVTFKGIGQLIEIPIIKRDDEGVKNET